MSTLNFFFEPKNLVHPKPHSLNKFQKTWQSQLFFLFAVVEDAYVSCVFVFCFFSWLKRTREGEWSLDYMGCVTSNRMTVEFPRHGPVRLHDQIAEGSFSLVFRGSDPHDHEKKYAIKRILCQEVLFGSFCLLAKDDIISGRAVTERKAWNRSLQSLSRRKSSSHFTVIIVDLLIFLIMSLM